MENLKYFQMISSSTWAGLNKYTTWQDKLYVCIPDIWKYDDLNAVCSKDLVNNFKIIINSLNFLIRYNNRFRS